MPAPRIRRRALTALAVTALAGALTASPGSAAVGSAFGPPPPQNPATAATGTATMHGDSASSDTTPYAGPSVGPVTAKRTALQSACPAITLDSDGFPVALCTTMLDRTPTVHLLDPVDGRSLASLPLAKGSLFGGVYAYLDDEDRLVVVDGNATLLRIAHHHDGSAWRLSVDESTSLAAALPDGAAVVGLSPGWDREVWIAASDGTVGTVGEDGTVRTLALGEAVQNSISTIEDRTAVVTEHALYLLSAGPDGTPEVRWRAPYDRGPGRKPGQLSWGSGATPTFFGPRTGTEYVTITDNAAPHSRLLVFRTDGGPAPLCALPVLTRPAHSGTEDSPIASGRSVFVTNTFGYPYPALPDGAPASVPSSGSFAGGMTRVDVRADESGCDVVWESDVKSAALPRLSLGDDLIYTTTVSGPTDLVGSHTFAAYSYAVVDPRTGRVVTSSLLGLGLLYNPLQMTGTTGRDGSHYQGTETGVVRVRRS